MCPPPAGDRPPGDAVAHDPFRSIRTLTADTAGRRWAAATVSVFAATLLVALVPLLYLFTDFLMWQGYMPEYDGLPAHHRAAFRTEWDSGLGTDSAASEVAGTLSKFGGTANPDWAGRYRAATYVRLRDGVSPEAAELYLPVSQLTPVALAAAPTRQQLGLLSLAARERSRLPGDLVRGLAKTLPWTWRPNDAGTANPAYLLTLFVAAVGLVAVRGVASFLAGMWAVAVGRRAAVKARRAVYQHGFRLSGLALREDDRAEVGDLLVRRTEHLRDGLAARLTDAVRGPLAAGLFALVLLFINPWAGAGLLFLAAVVWLVAGQTSAYFRRDARIAGRRAETRLGLLAESIGVTPLVRSYLMERWSQTRFERHLTDLDKATARRERGDSFARPVLSSVASLAAVGFLYIAARLVLAGGLSVAGLVAMAAALVGLVFAVNRWVTARQRVGRARAAAAGIAEFLDRRGDTGQPLDAEFLQPVQKGLELVDVAYREAGTGRMLLDGLTFSVPAGRRVALAFADPAEGRAFEHILRRFADPTGGELKLDGKNVRWLTAESVRTQVAVVGGGPQTYSDTVAHNVGCGEASYTLPRIIEAAKMVHAHQFVQKLPYGYETVVGTGGVALRPGERLRLALARAALRDPSVLVVEEPAEPLDPDSRVLVDDALNRLAVGRTLLDITTRPEAIRAADAVYVVRDGRVAAFGKPADLLVDGELFRLLR